MVIRRIHVVNPPDQLSTCEKFLHKVHQTLFHAENVEPAAFGFINAVRTYFSDGCALIVAGGGIVGHGLFDTFILEWVEKELAMDKREGTYGEEALRTFIEKRSSDTPIDLIFMDMQMPTMDGCEASLRIREYVTNHPDDQNGPHVVAMTANSFIEDKRACLRSGMCCFTAKPVQLERLEQVIIDGYNSLVGDKPCRCKGNGTISW